MSADKPSKLPQKQPMTDAERQVLCEKLDRELDEFISGLEKKAYTEGWPEDRWQEEMEKHPFFMTKPPAEGEPLPPLLEGIQQLKYDPEENTAEELATNYKEDGNFNFKYGKYRLAILSYTEGLRAKSVNPVINAELHNNRAAAHFFLKNYRSCLMDCNKAVQFQPSYLKAMRRAAKCCYLMAHSDDCVAWCDRGLQEAGGKDKELIELRGKAVAQKKVKERDDRKAALAKKLEDQSKENLKSAIKERGIAIKGWKTGDDLDLAALEPCFPAAMHCPVSLGADQCLSWPVLLLYPHYGVTDLIQSFHEDSTFEEHLNELFPPGSKVEWDSDQVFSSVTSLNIYFESENKNELVEVQKSSTLREVLKDNRYCVHNGTPSFIVVVAGSAAEKRIKNIS